MDETPETIRKYVPSCVRLVELLKNTSGSDIGALF